MRGPRHLALRLLCSNPSQEVHLTYNTRSVPQKGRMVQAGTQAAAHCLCSGAYPLAARQL